MKTMKTNYLLLAGILMLGLGSCGENFFEQYPSNSVTVDNFWKTDDDFNQAVVGCYGKLKAQMDFHLTELAYRSDECNLDAMATSTQNRYDIDHFAEVPSNGILLDVWNTWYNGIFRCNDVLNHLPGARITNHEKYQGECLFMRAWFYFNLYRVFGVVPLTRSVVTAQEAKTISRCTEEAMYELLTEDLTQAAHLLPDTYDAEIARVTSIAAYTLLAKVYLTFHKPTEAKVAIEEAMKNTAYGLHEDPCDMFLVDDKMNKEMIFALHYEKTTGHGHGYWYSASTNKMDDIVNPTAHFKSIYDEELDLRLRLITVYFKIKKTLYAMYKWYDIYDGTYTTQVGNDFPHLRYSDLVLMYAEALNELGDADAVFWLNKTRTRAGLAELTTADVPSKDEFRKELAAERGREFALEGQRWFDLVRLGLAVDYFTELGYTLDSHNLIFPIPQAQIEIVNNTKILWQNPGY